MEGSKLNRKNKDYNTVDCEMRNLDDKTIAIAEIEAANFTFRR